MMQSPVHQRHQSLHTAAAAGHVADVRALLVSEPLLNQRDEHGRTPIMRAVDAGHLDVLKELIEAGADIYRCDVHGSSPLHHATSRGLVEIAWCLLAAGAQVNACEPIRGMTPLHCAVISGHTNLVHLLLRAGALPHLTDCEGLTALDLARTYVEPEIESLLRAASVSSCSHKVDSGSDQSE